MEPCNKEAREEQRREEDRIYMQRMEAQAKRAALHKNWRDSVKQYGKLDMNLMRGNEPFVLNGLSYSDIGDFLDGIKENEVYTGQEERGKPSLTVSKNGKGQFLLYSCESIPCFDSFDYANSGFQYTYLLCGDLSEAYRLLEFVSQYGVATYHIPSFVGSAIFYESGDKWFKMGECATYKGQKREILDKLIKDFKELTDLCSKI